MAEKLLDELTIKLAPEKKRRFAALAEMEGESVSERLRRLIERDISNAEERFRAMSSIFGDANAPHKE